MAKASSLADTLGKHLECAVCLEQYTEPKVLPCLHTFCKRCLQGLLTHEEDVWKINCPSCRSFAEITQGRVDLLPVNFFVNNLLSVVALHKDLESGDLKCNVCESGDPPVNRCAICLHFLCEFCSQAHRQGCCTSSHNLMSLEEAKTIGSVSGSIPSFCKEHEEEVKKLFCETCSEAICRDCIIIKHRDHQYTFVRDAFPTCKENLMKLLSETKTKLSNLEEALDTATDMKTRIHNSAEQTRQKVIECFDELSALVDTRCAKLISHLNSIKEAKLRSLAIQQLELKTAHGCLQSGVEFTESAFENGSKVDILNIQGQISNWLQDLISSHWQMEPCVDEGFNFRDDNLSVELEHEISKLCVITGEVANVPMLTVTMEHGQDGVMYNTLCGQPVKFTITARKQNGAITSEGGDVFKVQIDLNGAGMVFSLTAHFCTEKGTYCFLYTPEKEGHYLMSVVLNGHHIQGSPFTWFVEKWTLKPFSSGNKHIQIRLSKEKLTASYRMCRKVPGFGGLKQSYKTTARTYDLKGTLLGVSTFAVTSGITFDVTSLATSLGTTRTLFGSSQSPFPGDVTTGTPTSQGASMMFGTFTGPSQFGHPRTAFSPAFSTTIMPNATGTPLPFRSASKGSSATDAGEEFSPFGATALPPSSGTGFSFGTTARVTGSGSSGLFGSTAQVPTQLSSSGTGFSFGTTPCVTGSGSSGLFGSTAQVPTQLSSSGTGLSFGTTTRVTGSGSSGLFGSTTQVPTQLSSSGTGFSFGTTPCVTGSGSSGLFGSTTQVPTQPPCSGTGFSLGTGSSGLSGSTTQVPSFGIAGLRFQTQTSTDGRPDLSSVGFSSGRHMWKVKIHGKVMDGFSFGIINITRKPNVKLTKLGNWWAWNSKLKQFPLPSGAQSSVESTITDCASGDIIELYLDHGDGTLKMYNPRTKQSDVWSGVKGEVLPLFFMTAHGDGVSLKLQ